MAPKIIYHKPVRDRISKRDSTTAFLREMGRIPLLTRDQEVELGQQIQAMMHLLSAKAKLQQTLGYEPTEAQLAESVLLRPTTIRSVLHQGHRAREKMIEANLRLVVSIARRYQYRGMELQDLIQEGAIGLKIAAERFDPKRGRRFSTMAYYWIWQAVTRALRTQRRMIRIPVYLEEKLDSLKKTRQRLSQQLRRTPTIEELAPALELSSQQLQELLLIMQPPASLDEVYGLSERTPLIELLAADGPTPADAAEQRDVQERVLKLLELLSERQREVMMWRYGLLGEDPLTLDEVGKRFGTSKQRIKQLEDRAMEKLRQHQDRVAELVPV
jgi:RNA polymerase nonessential primary-like sigma factor